MANIVLEHEVVLAEVALRGSIRVAHRAVGIVACSVFASVVLKPESIAARLALEAICVALLAVGDLARVKVANLFL